MILNEENENLTETAAQKLLKMPNVWWKKWKTLGHAAAEQHVAQYSQNVEQSGHKGEMEDKALCLSEEGQLAHEHINEENASDAAHEHLLILAHSAELMLESEDIVDRVTRNDHNHEDHKSPGEHFDGMLVIDHLRSEMNGFQLGGRTPRLSQIRRQARLKSNLLLQPRLGVYVGEHLERRRTRLTKVRQQARAKYHSQLEDKEENCLCNNSRVKIIRLSQLRHQARSISNTSTQEAADDHMHRQLDYPTSEENERKRTIAGIFGEDDSFQVVNGVGQAVKPVKRRIRLSQLRREARLGNVDALGRGECNATVMSCCTADKG